MKLYPVAVATDVVLLYIILALFCVLLMLSSAAVLFVHMYDEVCFWSRSQTVLQGVSFLTSFMVYSQNFKNTSVEIESVPTPPTESATNYF